MVTLELIDAAITLRSTCATVFDRFASQEPEVAERIAALRDTLDDYLANVTVDDAERDTAA